MFIIDHSSEDSKACQYNQLDNIVLTTSSDLSAIIIISGTSIKNNIATSITYVHLFSNFLKKTLHHAINIIITDVELFAIRCGINQAIQIPGILYMVIITNALHVAQKIFDLSLHLY